MVLDLIFGVLLGALSAGIITLLVRSRSLNQQVDALRTEVAMARIERVLDGGDAEAPPDVVRRKRHLGLVRTGGVVGVALGALAWIRCNQAATVGAVSTAALVAATAAVYLGSPDTRHDEPAAPAPTQSAAYSATPPAGPDERPSPASASPLAAPSPGSSRVLQPGALPPSGSTGDTRPVGPPLPTLPALPTLPTSPQPPTVSPSSAPAHDPMCVRTMLVDRGRAEVCLTP